MASKLSLATVNTVHDIADAGADTLGAGAVQADYFVQREGLTFAGTHLLLEFWGAATLDDPEHCRQALCEAARDAGATILHVHAHHFSPNQGVSAVAVLAESHISIHTWPERSYAAIDIFMCGECNPYDAIPALRRAFRPANLQIAESKRGLIPSLVDNEP